MVFHFTPTFLRFAESTSLICPQRAQRRERKTVRISVFSVVNYFPRKLRWFSRKLSVPTIHLRCAYLPRKPYNFVILCSIDFTNLFWDLWNKSLIMEIDRCIMRRLGRPHEITNAIVFLASDEASFITATTLHVDGGRVANWKSAALYYSDSLMLYSSRYFKCSSSKG